MRQRPTGILPYCGILQLEEPPWPQPVGRRLTGLSGTRCTSVAHMRQTRLQDVRVGRSREEPHKDVTRLAQIAGPKRQPSLHRACMLLIFDAASFDGCWLADLMTRVERRGATGRWRVWMPATLPPLGIAAGRGNCLDWGSKVHDPRTVLSGTAIRYEMSIHGRRILCVWTIVTVCCPSSSKYRRSGTKRPVHPPPKFHLLSKQFSLFDPMIFQCCCQ